MKSKILFFLFIFIAQNGFSKCGWGDINAWPTSFTISENPILVIEGLINYQSFVEGLNGKFKIYLKSSSGDVPLQVVRINKGQFLISQAILKPTKTLKKGFVYALRIEGLEKTEKVNFYRKNFRWKVANNADNRVAKWTSLPSYLSKEIIEFGCGPSSKVSFCMCIQDQSPYLIVTKVKNRKTNNESEYYLNAEQNVLYIGNDMCSGAFKFVEGQEYEVSFSIIDASGNTDKSFTKPILFTSPSSQDASTNALKVKCNCS
ncbi:MAG: hypothetical protein ACRCVT_12060 [Leadbetterella sp.]